MKTHHLPILLYFVFFHITGCENNESCHCSISKQERSQIIEIDTLYERMMADRLSNYLERYREPDLSVLNREAYRYIYSGAFGQEVIVRAIDEGQVKSLIVKSVVGFTNEGFDTTLVMDKRLISEEEWNSLKSVIDKNCFWTMPRLSRQAGLDGYTIDLEAYIPKGNDCTFTFYRSLGGWAPTDSAFVKICNEFRALIE